MEKIGKIDDKIEEMNPFLSKTNKEFWENTGDKGKEFMTGNTRKIAVEILEEMEEFDEDEFKDAYIEALFDNVEVNGDINLEEG